MEGMPAKGCSIINKLVRRRKTGYQRFKRLSLMQQDCMMKSDEPPFIKNLALAYRGFTKESLENSLKWAKSHQKRYRRALSSYYLELWKNKKSPLSYDSRSKVSQEFLFNGYVPYEDFAHKMKPGRGYLISNPNSPEKWIYPKHFGHDYKSLKRFEDVYIAQSLYGIEGYTQVKLI